MNYKGKKIAITGASGFIGDALHKRLSTLIQDGTSDKYNYVRILDGDVRTPETFKALDHTYDYLFHFAAPSSQVLFKRQPAFAIESTIAGLVNAAQACQRHGIRLIYPSTGLLSSDRYNEYAMCKKISEDYVAGLGIDALGIRIFATYGPGEGHKADYASVPYLFARDMVQGISPIVFGDGEQVRDFIYVDDTVEAIVRLAEQCYDPVVDVGSGESLSFNRIIAEINELNVLPVTIRANYQEAPNGYVMETAANPKRLHDFYTPKVTLAEGLSKLTKHLVAERDSKS